MNKRPRVGSNASGSVTSTPRSAMMMKLLGAGNVTGAVALSRDEFSAINKLYGLAPEKPNKKPPPPAAPRREDFEDAWKFEHAQEDHKRALKAHENWQDPIAFMQAGADRNAVRHAEVDGLRLMAWIARFVPPGEDPVKTLIQLALDAGWDVDPSDATWVEGEESGTDDEG